MSEERTLAPRTLVRFSWPASELPRLLTPHTAAVTCVVPREISSHFISIRKSALESSSLCEFGPRGHSDASRGGLAPACVGMCTRGCWWHRVVLAHGTPGTAAPNPPQTQTHRCRGQGALTPGHQSHPFTQKPGRVRRCTLAPLQRQSPPQCQRSQDRLEGAFLPQVYFCLNTVFHQKRTLVEMH